jgi:hypothetical protein
VYSVFFVFFVYGYISKSSIDSASTEFKWGGARVDRQAVCISIRQKIRAVCQVPFQKEQKTMVVGWFACLFVFWGVFSYFFSILDGRY